jgi:hypothetical protein
MDTVHGTGGHPGSSHPADPNAMYGTYAGNSADGTSSTDGTDAGDAGHGPDEANRAAGETDSETAAGPHEEDGGPLPPWEQLVTTALLGTDRRRPPESLLRSGREAPTALLGAAALHTVRRRAGLRPGPAAPLPEPALPDDRPALPEAARARLAQLLSGRSAPSAGGRRGAAPDLTELLPQWLTAAAAHGYRAPEPLLPALLDTARGRSDLRPQALAFAGTRGVWLARFNPEWRFALRGAAGGSAPLPDPADSAAVASLWQEGLFAERVALLSAVRAHDPALGRELLAGSWARERAEDRLMFLDSLRGGLSPADESFLEQALSDRSRNVRTTAAELLSALPGSALAGRMAVRAARCVRVTETASGPVLSVTAPAECDAGMERDGVPPQAPAGRGERAWWLGRVVEAAPLATWTERFGGRSAHQMTALPVADGWAGELHAAWCRAAVRQGDPEWARALLGAPGLPSAMGPDSPSIAERAQLLTALPREERARWTAEFIAAHGLSDAFQLLAVCAVPWSGPLGRSVVDALDIAREAGSYPWSFSGVMGLAERCLCPAEAGRLEVLTAAPDETESTSPGAGAYWSEAFQRLVSTLRLRETMLAELAPGTP